MTQATNQPTYNDATAAAISLARIFFTPTPHRPRAAATRPRSPVVTLEMGTSVAQQEMIDPLEALNTNSLLRSHSHRLAQAVDVPQ